MKEFFDIISELNLVVLSKCKTFKYLGSVVNQDSTSDDIIWHCVSVWWMKSKKNFGIFCDKKMPPKLKGKLYTMRTESAGIAMFFDEVPRSQEVKKKAGRRKKQNWMTRMQKI